MENLTHTLSGIAMAEALGLRERWGRPAVVALAVASNLPDIDVLLLGAGDIGIFLRRTTFHSYIGLPVLALLMAQALKRFWPQLGLARLFAIGLLGSAGHVLLDLVNSFGVVLHAPFETTRFEFATVFIVDPILTALVAVPLLLTLRGALQEHRRAACALGLAAVSVYLGFCGLHRRYAVELLAPKAEGASFSYVFPEPLGPHRWRGVVRRDDGWDVYLLRTFEDAVEPAGHVASMDADPRVDTAKRDLFGQACTWFFKAPVWTADGGIVTASDLRFTSLVLPGRPNPFVFRFGVDRWGVRRLGWMR